MRAPLSASWPAVSTAHSAASTGEGTPPAARTACVAIAKPTASGASTPTTSLGRSPRQVRPAAAACTVVARLA